MIKLLHYISSVIDHMEEGRDFTNEREYEKYVQDLTKGIEMLNLLLNANLHYREKMRSQGRNMDRFFNHVTDSMYTVRESLKDVQVFIPSELKDKKITSFYDYDFSFPVFNKDFKPILPKFVDSGENKENIARVK